MSKLGPLSPAERRARKARARAAKIEEARSKREAAVRDERVAELDRQDGVKGFGFKVGHQSSAVSSVVARASIRFHRMRSRLCKNKCGRCLLVCLFDCLFV